jgi:hypothetical protein
MPPPVLRAQDKLRLEVGEEGWVEREGVVEVVEWASTRRRFSSSSSRRRKSKVEEEQCFRLCLRVRRLGKPAHGDMLPSKRGGSRRFLDEDIVARRQTAQLRRGYFFCRKHMNVRAHRARGTV